MLIRYLSNLYAVDGGADGGETEGEDLGRKVKSSDVLARYGMQATDSALRVAERVAELENSNYKLRTKRDELQRELAAAQTKAAPDGAVVLTSEQAKAWEAYQQIGKPEELASALTDRDTTQGELATLRRDKMLSTVAEAHGYKAATLAKLPSLSGKDLILKDVTEGDATVKRAFVKDGQTETAIAEYIEKNDPEFLPALTAGGEKKGGGTPYPAQQSNANGGKPAQSAAKAYIQNTKYALPKRES